METDEVHRTRVASSHLDRTTEFGQEPGLLNKKRMYYEANPYIFSVRQKI